VRWQAWHRLGDHPNPDCHTLRLLRSCTCARLRIKQHLLTTFLVHSQMPYRAISQDLKERVLFLLDNDIGPDNFELDIAEIFGVSPRSIRRWQRNVDLYGSVIPPKNHLQGRPRILNGNQTHHLLTLPEEAPEMYLDEIQDWVAISHDLSISKSTLDLIIRDAGFSYKMLSTRVKLQQRGMRWQGRRSRCGLRRIYSHL